ncbi:MAG: hypothetical protein V4439_04275 [Patescibacteria group bacterium]
MNFIVSINRSTKPDYIFFIRELRHPELECSGPETYDLSLLGFWYNKNRIVKGKTIFKELKKIDALKKCLNLQDLLAIKEKGTDIFLQLFGDKILYAWKSVSMHDDGNLYVPCLWVQEDEEENCKNFLLAWHWLGNEFLARHLNPYFI